MKPGRGSARILIAGVIGVVWIPAARAGEPTFTKHVVVAQEAHAADVGRNVLRAGGNAIDAAVATAFALAVTVPEAGNLGGGGFIVSYLADRREVVTVDFRETAPRSASPRMYRSKVNPGRKRCVPSRQPWATTGGQSTDWESPTRSSSILQPARSMALPIVAARLQSPLV